MPTCQSAVRKTVLIEGHNELELKKPGQVFYRSSADSSKMFLCSYAFFIVLIFIYCRCKYVVSNKWYYFGGNHSGDSMNITVKVYYWRISFNIQHTKSYFTQNLWYAYLLFCTVLINVMAFQKRQVRFRLTWGITCLIRHIISSNVMRSFGGELFWQIDRQGQIHKLTDTIFQLNAHFLGEMYAKIHRREKIRPLFCCYRCCQTYLLQWSIH